MRGYMISFLMVCNQFVYPNQALENSLNQLHAKLTSLSAVLSIEASPLSANLSAIVHIADLELHYNQLLMSN